MALTMIGTIVLIGTEHVSKAKTGGVRSAGLPPLSQLRLSPRPLYHRVFDTCPVV